MGVFSSGPTRKIRPQSKSEGQWKTKSKAAIIILKSCVPLKKHFFCKRRNLGLENVNELLKVKQLIRGRARPDPPRSRSLFNFPRPLLTSLVNGGSVTLKLSEVPPFPAASLENSSLKVEQPCDPAVRPAVTHPREPCAQLFTDVLLVTLKKVHSTQMSLKR